jgi:NAD-dependent deacetylase
VVWFGEALPQDVWKQAMVYASSCDAMFVVGTSLAVSPANLLPVYAKQNGALIVEVNPENTQMSETMDLSVKSTAANALPKIVSIFEKARIL